MTHFSQKRRKELTFVLLMIAIPLIQFIIFWGYVNLDSILMGFKNMNGAWSLANFDRFWNEVKKGLIQSSIANSLINLAVAEFITLPLVMVFSYLLYKKCYGSSLFRVLFYLPSLISAVVMSNLFSALVTPFGSNSGPYIMIMQKLGLNVSKDVLKYGLLGMPRTAFATIMVYCLWTGVGMNLVLLSGALARAPQDLFDAGKVDGCGMGREFINIVVPLIWPTITTLFIFNLAGCFTMYMPIMLLTNGEYDTMTIGYYIVKHTINSNGDLSTLGYPAAVGLIFTAISMPIILFVKWLFNKISEAVEY